jgi:ParB-like chromosome segregation protein Spo0J
MTIPTNSAPIIGRGVSSIFVEETPVSSLKPYRANARTHTKHQIRQLANSIVAFGFTDPILIDSNNRILSSDRIPDWTNWQG